MTECPDDWMAGWQDSEPRRRSRGRRGRVGQLEEPGQEREQEGEYELDAGEEEDIRNHSTRAEDFNFSE
jgi:hypothetical protein